MRAHRGLWWSAPAALVCAVPGHATQYLTVEQAQQAIFPGASFTRADVTLSDEQKKEIEHASGVDVRNATQQVWKVDGGGWLIVDEVLGKHEFITYAVGLLADGSVKQVEIMDYRETYGYEVRDAAWRAQFVGKTAQSKLHLDDDIKNVSGATLSCRHITDGVRRLLAFHAVALR
jgi:Na+-translocating ferredoxin:NAD+ oxidoreductase RnfG subunit